MPVFIYEGSGEEKVEVSGVYTCAECGQVARFARGETFPPCPRCHKEGAWHLIRKIWEPVTRV